MEEESNEAEIQQDIPIVITDDDILHVNEEDVGGNSRPQNRAGCRSSQQVDTEV